MSRIMTDRELLDALDLEHPGLEAVRIAVRRVQDGTRGAFISVEEAAASAAGMGLPVPGVDEKPRASSGFLTSS